MKKKQNKCSREIAALNEKCDLLIEMVRQLGADPDFLIARLRFSAKRRSGTSRGNDQNISTCG